jgi:hypothetical protein
MSIAKTTMSVGARMWYLTVESEPKLTGKKGNYMRKTADFKCDCGKIINAGVYSVYYGLVRSCGCKSGSGYISTKSQLNHYSNLSLVCYDDIVLSSKIETAEKELTENYQSDANIRLSFETLFNSTYKLLNRQDKQFDFSLIEKELTVGDMNFNN